MDIDKKSQVNSCYSWDIINTYKSEREQCIGHKFIIRNCETHLGIWSGNFWDRETGTQGYRTWVTGNKPGGGRTRRMGTHRNATVDMGREGARLGFRLADDEGPGRRDASYYDLLASEARLASFLAIAKGDVSESHWFHLGRAVTAVRGAPVLLSWSATMFEYLMPLLVMRTYPDTLLDETCRMVVRRQMEYGAIRGVPRRAGPGGLPAQRRRIPSLVFPHSRCQPDGTPRWSASSS